MTRLSLMQTSPLIQEDDGTVHITGSRVTLDTLVGAFQKGASAEQIQDSFPSLSLRDIYGAIAYYLEHEAEVMAYLDERHRSGAVLRQSIEARQDTEGFRERVRARRAQMIKP